MVEKSIDLKLNNRRVRLIGVTHTFGWLKQEEHFLLNEMRGSEAIMIEGAREVDWYPLTSDYIGYGALFEAIFSHKLDKPLFSGDPRLDVAKKNLDGTVEFGEDLERGLALSDGWYQDLREITLARNLSLLTQLQDLSLGDHIISIQGLKHNRPLQHLLASTSLHDLNGRINSFKIPAPYLALSFDPSLRRYQIVGRKLDFIFKYSQNGASKPNFLDKRGWAE